MLEFLVFCHEVIEVMLLCPRYDARYNEEMYVSASGLLMAITKLEFAGLDAEAVSPPYNVAEARVIVGVL